MGAEIGDTRLDSREIQERMDELDGEIEELTEAMETATEAEHEDISEEREELKDELAAWQEMKDDSGDEWEYGIQFIREDDFENHARELAEDVGAIDREAAWPSCHIDWEAASESLMMDYTTTDIKGHTYYYR